MYIVRGIYVFETERRYTKMNWFKRFMVGRYGADPLGFALCAANIVFWIFAAITGWWALSILSYICCIWMIWRMFSKKIYQRQKENRIFLSWWNPIQKSITQWIFRVKDRSHRYIRCKNCKERLRLPKGKGRIEVTCPKCRERFITKT